MLAWLRRLRRDIFEKTFNRYYFQASCYRKTLDALLEKHKPYYKGVVLDVGGRDRGAFAKPKQDVDKWIFADIEEKHNPDIVLDIANMKGVVDDKSVDCINAINLFEHVYDMRRALEECVRVLKVGGVIIISVPFLVPVHADPYDFQRWTIDKWRIELGKAGFVMEVEERIGGYFMIIMEMIRVWVISAETRLKYLGYLMFPIMDVIVLLDNTGLVKENSRLNKYHGGYFFIARKNGAAE
ncbi:MAG: methyltransferase domain-containing protein [Candidatus Nitrospinota bacterium M3_3B_026]